MDTNVAMVKGEVKGYPKTPPFHPSECYPEYPFDGKYLTPGNGVYLAVRDRSQETPADGFPVGGYQSLP